jgi:hypothetical protein
MKKGNNGKLEFMEGGNGETEWKREGWKTGKGRERWKMGESYCPSNKFVLHLSPKWNKFTNLRISIIRR